MDQSSSDGETTLWEKEKFLHKGAVVESVALRRFIQISKRGTTAASVIESTSDLKALLSCFSSLDHIRLKTRRNSEMRREMGVKHVRIQTPEEEHVDCFVQRARPHSRQKRKNVGVLRPANAEFTVLSRRFPGPKVGDKGTIVPHSILGDVESFVNEAKRRGDFEEIIKNQDITIKHPRTKPVQRVSKTTCNPQKLNEEKALQYWKQEMLYRKMEQKHLANTLNRPVGDLLMTRTNDMMRRNDIEMLMKQQDGKFHPDVCFWTLEPRHGNRQIMQTLTRTEKGHPKTPCIGGDGATIRKEKGKSDVSVSSFWDNPEFFEKQQKDSGGVIHIANSVLFEELELCGHAVPVPVQFSSMTNSLTSPCRSVCSRNMASSQLGSIHEEIIQNELFCEENGESACQTSSRCEQKEGPSLCIGGTTLSWRGNIKVEEASPDRIAKEEFVLIEAKVGEMVKGHLTFENNGTVVLRYFWKKLPVFRPLPIKRPVRRPFYFFDDAGSIRPGEIVHVPVLLRSQIPGYFTESWLLDTLPVLENGAQIKFSLKGVVRVAEDYTKQCLDIEEYLRKKKVETLCLQQTRYILLPYSNDRDEPVCLTREEMFKETNPGFYFHESIVKELWIMFDIVSMDTKAATDDPVLCIARLRKMIIDMPCSPDDDEEEHFTRQNELFESFCCKIVPLTFRPLLPWELGFCIKQLILNTLLREGMEQFAHETYKVADLLGLVQCEVLGYPRDGKSSRWKNHNGTRAKVAAIGKLKSKDNKDHSPPRADFVQDSEETPQFSPLTKFKQINGTECKNLVLYEEKTYLMMYQILTGILDTFDGFFVQ